MREVKVGSLLKPNLRDFSSNLHSQHGEDGIIAAINRWLGLESGTCVEFGAWDGYKFSNTAHLWETGWKALLLEGDRAKYALLKEKTRHKEKVETVCAMVGTEPGTRWHDYASGGRDVDIVSIDVDGNDYWIFEESPRGPKLYIVEHNTSIPPWLDVWTPQSPDNNFGCSLGALERLAQEKGYRYIGSTRSNGFFLRADLCGKIPDLDVDLHNAGNKDDLVYLMTSYSGDFLANRIGPYGRGKYYGKAVYGLI